MPPATARRWSLPSLFAALATLTACAGPEPVPIWSPGALSPQQVAACKEVELLYREQSPDYGPRSEQLAADPVAVAWFVRMLIRDVLQARDGRNVSDFDSRLRLAAGFDDPLESRALAAIEAFGVAAAPTVVGDLLQHPQGRARELGYELTARIGSPAVPFVLPMTSSPEPKQRRAAARALGVVDGGEAALVALQRLAEDADFLVRGDAMRGLAGHDSAVADQLLRQRLQSDPDPYVRRQAARALGQRPSVEAAAALVDYLDRCARETDGQGEQLAQESLQQMAGTRGFRTPEAWRNWIKQWRPSQLR
jgi:HEAT repeat protein